MPVEYRLHPVFRVRAPYGVPEHPPFSLWADDRRWDEAKRQDGITNLRRYALEGSLSSHIENAGTGNEQERRNRAIGLNFTLRAQDEYNTVSAWEMVPGTKEREQLDRQRSKYETLRDELRAEQRNKTLTPEQEELLQSYSNLVGQLQLLTAMAATGQIGFIEEIPSIFGYGGLSMHDLNSAPNVHKVRRSTFAIDADRPFHITLRFAHPHPDQRTTVFKLRWGAFVLELVGGTQAKLYMYNKANYGSGSVRDLRRITQWERRLEYFLDLGRLTDVDMDYIEARETRIRELRRELREKKIKHTDEAAYRPYYTAIESLKGEIEARRKLKNKRPGAAQREVDRIERLLYAIAGEALNLNESSENFYGDEGTMRLTVLPQRRGFVTFILNGGEPRTVRLPEIVESRQYQTVWGRTRLLWEYNGGAVDWQFAFPSIDSEGELRFKSVAVPFTLQPGDRVSLDGDWDTTLPGTKISFAINPSDNYQENDPRYDFIASFRSDVGRDEEPGNTLDVQNMYIPWLYSLRYFINSGDRPANEDVLWSTEDFGRAPDSGSEPSPRPMRTFNTNSPNPNYDNPLLDVTVNYDDAGQTRRGAQVTMDVHDPDGTANFKGYENHLCDFLVGLWLPATAPEPGQPRGTVSGVVPYFNNLVIREAVLMNARNLDVSQATFAEMFGCNTFWRLALGDVWSLIDDFRLPCDVILDGRTLGASLRRLLATMGWTAADLAGIAESGPLAGPTLRKAAAGEAPLRVYNEGDSLGSACRELLDDFGIAEDNRELRLSAHQGVFRLDAPSTELKFAFSSAWAATGPQVVKLGQQRVQNWDKFYNVFTVRGRRDKKSGEPLQHVYSIPESYTAGYEAHPLHIGYEKRYPISNRPDLDAQGDVERAAEILALRNAKSGEFDFFESCWLYPPRYPGDRGTVDGKERELIKIDGMKLNSTNVSLAMRAIVELP